MLGLLKRIAARLPARWQQALKRRHFASQIRRGRFGSDEPEYAMLDELLSPGDWALDIGANVGSYAERMSRLVGPEGRVVACEPVPATFALLAANAQLFPYPNVTLMNVAASREPATAGMEVPVHETGLRNYYMASLAEGAAGFEVLCLPIDSLRIPGTVRLAKIDTEGHEMSVLEGMAGLIERDHPTLIVEASSGEITRFAERFGYACERLPGSSNYLCRFSDA